MHTQPVTRTHISDAHVRAHRDTQNKQTDANPGTHDSRMYICVLSIFPIKRKKDAPKMSDTLISYIGVKGYKQDKNRSHS